MPVGVIVKDRLWPRLNYAPHAAQRRVHASRTRNRVNAAGRRTGKSTLGGHELVPFAFQAYLNRGLLEDLGIRHETWIVGPNYTDSEKEFRVFYNDCKRLRFPLDKPGTYYSKSEMSVSLWGGRFIVHAKSGLHPESLVGEGLHFALMAEAAKMKESVWQRFIRPTLADFNGTSLWNSTPEGKNWFYRVWQKGLNPNDSEWESFRHPSWSNNYVFRKRTTKEGVERLKEMLEHGGFSREHLLELPVDPEIVSMAMDLTADSFAQEVECSFTDMVGRVFKDWDEETHVGDFPYNPAWPLFIATDYGYTHPNVALFIQEGPFGEVRVIAEYYRTQRTEEEFANDVMNDSRLSPLLPAARAIYPDPEDPGATATLVEKWKVPSSGGTGGELKLRLKAIQRSLKVRNPHLPWGHPERIPSLMVDRSCTNLIKEMDGYSWPKRKEDARRGSGPERPMDKDDHTPEALGRYYAGRAALTGNRSRITTARRHRPPASR